MGKSVQIIQQGALVERPYQDRNGQQQVFASMGFTLTDGVDTFYAEMQGDLARSFRDIHPDPSLLHRVQTQMSIRHHPRRPLRQHCPRLQQRNGHQAQPVSGRLCGHRGRFRR